MKKLYLIIGTIGIFLAIVITILVKMFTLPTDISLIKTLKTPDLPEISELLPGNFRQKAVSLDGKIIQGTNKSPQPTASTAKMILGLAIMEKKPFLPSETGETIAITPEYYNKYLWYVTHNGSTTKVAIGEEISEYDALTSVFLASSNNMADTLAIWAFGSLENYRAYATDLIARLGLNNTTVGVDASGYSETTASTAEDLARAAGELLKDPILKEIVGLKTHTVPVAGELTNTNKILGDSLNNGSQVIGVKTGYIGDLSGYNLISAYEINGHTISLALLGADTREASFTESKDELMRLSAEIVPTTVVNKDESVGYFETWWNGKHEIKTDSEITVVGIKNDQIETSLTDVGFIVRLDGEEYTTKTYHEAFSTSPTLWEHFLHVFGWSYN
ncbi:D-alanyl-D-alanine carboxypeptidase [Candidatus Saccharibacteria bacterium]|nr:D-alanyl-D-alanine carboxypeptidase [Candidatus Saccharibacteria bacterium]